VFRTGLFSAAVAIFIYLMFSEAVLWLKLDNCFNEAGNELKLCSHSLKLLCAWLMFGNGFGKAGHRS
jgi:hypothetical protein